PHRRQGLGRTLTRQAAAWAATHGATDLSLLVTRRNSPAFSLYTSLNFRPVGHYHYREMPEA
ncbi:MAG: GNAT family N-acetyltransferase, partial [Pseudomonadota bacterium]